MLKNNIDFNAVKGKTKIPDQKWKDLLDHFNQPGFVLVNDNFEFPDLLGAAYEYLIKYFADSAGKKGGEFYTPAEVVRLLVQLTKPTEGNEIYDPAAGSGGFLIQAHQYVEEQGENANNLALYGQDSNGTTWSICNMNMILHNITSFTIENGDTLEDPLILQNGQLRKFDRVLANPPFSQNYSRANMQFTHRFREWCPETGKKADLMFVQHMLASLKSNGHMATIMPHGVLFRGGKEKLIRELLINDDVIEAIISLPQGLFYGTGIPACVLVCNKNKPDALRDKVLFINADREYAEGKNQNKLRPEDIEKIDFVFTHKREIPKYSRLVDKSEIADTTRLQPEHPALCGQHARAGTGRRTGPSHRRPPRSRGDGAKRYLRQIRPSVRNALPAGPTGLPVVPGGDYRQGRYQRLVLKQTNRSRAPWIPTALPWKSGGAWPVMILPRLSAPITAGEKCRKSGRSC